MAIKKRVDYESPDGFQIFENEMPVAGVHARISACTAFIKGKKHQIAWAREPNNAHDSNAIRIVGTTKGLFGTKQRFLGYVPAEVSARIAAGDWFDSLIPRLRFMRISDDGYVEITFDIIGPKGEKKSYFGE